MFYGLSVIIIIIIIILFCPIIHQYNREEQYSRSDMNTNGCP